MYRSRALPLLAALLFTLLLVHRAPDAPPGCHDGAGSAQVQLAAGAGAADCWAPPVAAGSPGSLTPDADRHSGACADRFGCPECVLHPAHPGSDFAPAPAGVRDYARPVLAWSVPAPDRHAATRSGAAGGPAGPEPVADLGVNRN